MKNEQIRKLCLAGLLTAVAVAGSLFSFPVLGAKCAPVQHMVNIVCAVFLGPAWGVGVAFAASFLRNLMGLGSLLAFPGSMIGAFCCGMLWKATKNLPATCVAESIGTGILGGLCAWPVAILFMGKSAGDVAFYAYVTPFLVSTVGGSIIAGICLMVLLRGGALKKYTA